VLGKDPGSIAVCWFDSKSPNDKPKTMIMFQGGTLYNIGQHVGKLFMFLYFN